MMRKTERKNFITLYDDIALSPHNAKSICINFILLYKQDIQRLITNGQVTLFHVVRSVCRINKILGRIVERNNPPGYVRSRRKFDERYYNVRK